MSKWIKKDDQVLITTGNDKGRIGPVLFRKGDYVKVQGMNIRKKHAKRRTKTGRGDILEMEAPIHISNVCLCTPEGKPIRPKVRLSSQGEKELFYQEGGKEIVLRQIRKS